MKLIMLCGLTVIVAGCAAVAGITPSLQYCTDVTYVRHGNEIDVTAKCHAPIGGGVLPGVTQ